MKILVTGANGFIGSNLCGLLKKDNEVIGIGTKENTEVSGIEYHKMNIDSANFVTEIKDMIRSCDIIIHLAALIDKDNFNEKIIDVNCKGALNILKAAKALDVKTIIHASSVPIIGMPIDKPITEEHRTLPESLYHITKLAAERIIDMAINDGIKTVHLRIPSPIGIGMNRKTILPTMLKKCINNEQITIYGKGGRRQNYIDVRDICDAIIKVIQYDVNGIYNIASEESISNLELAKLCISISDSNSQIVFNGLEDPEENCSWDISIEKAKRELMFEVSHSLVESIKNLLESLQKDS